MRRILRVFSLILAFHLAGFIVLVLGTASLVSFGAAELASPLLAVGLAVLIVAAPLAAGHLVPGPPRQVSPTCPCCGAILAGAKPVIESPLLW